MASLNSVVYLTEDQYKTLVENGTITVGDITVNYDENSFYVTDYNSSSGDNTGGSTTPVEVVVDTELSTTSNNPVANSTITNALNGLVTGNIVNTSDANYSNNIVNNGVDTYISQGTVNENIMTTIPNVMESAEPFTEIHNAGISVSPSSAVLANIDSTTDGVNYQALMTGGDQLMMVTGYTSTPGTEEQNSMFMLVPRYASIGVQNAWSTQGLSLGDANISLVNNMLDLVNADNHYNSSLTYSPVAFELKYDYETAEGTTTTNTLYLDARESTFKYNDKNILTEDDSPKIIDLTV